MKSVNSLGQSKAKNAGKPKRIFRQCANLPIKWFEKKLSSVDPKDKFRKIIDKSLSVHESAMFFDLFNYIFGLVLMKKRII